MKAKEVYDELRRIAGPQVAIQMVEAFQGQFVSIWRKNCEFMKHLRRLTDKETADQFYNEHGRQQIYIGKKETLLRDIRNEEIAEGAKMGMDYNTLCRKYGLSFQAIYKIIHKKKAVA